LAIVRRAVCARCKTSNAPAIASSLVRSAVTVDYEAEIITAVRAMEGGTGWVEPIELSQDYLKAGGRNSERRLVQVGYRLGSVLKGIVAE